MFVSVRYLHEPKAMKFGSISPHFSILWSAWRQLGPADCRGCKMGSCLWSLGLGAHDLVLGDLLVLSVHP